MKTKTLLKTLLVGLVFAFFGCTEETIINNIVDDTDGKVNIYIEGNITNAEAQAKLQAQIGTLTENIYVQNTTQLTAININAVGNMRDIVIKNNPLLTTININGNNSKGNLIHIWQNNALQTVNINGLTELNYLNFQEQNPNNSTTFICNDLLAIYYTFHISIINNFNDNIIEFPNLKYVFGITEIINDSPSINSFSSIYGKYSVFNFEDLEEVEEVVFNIRTETVNLLNLKRASVLDFSNCNSIVTLNIPSLIKCDYFSIYRNKINSNTINSLLNKFLTVLPISGKQIHLHSQNPPAPPTGTGIDNKNTLITQGNTVYTD